MRRKLIVCVVLMAALATAQSLKPGPPALPLGKVIARVPCFGHPEEGYSLYLPSNYGPSQRWPIIYAFDPDGRGRAPVELFKDAAEKYGYIVVGSNSIRNFSPRISEALSALWQDTHTRFALDPARSYMAGFSGGARVAGEAAILCTPCKIAAVIAEGAGYPDDAHPAKSDSLLYFFGIGEQDFNWPEIVKVRRHREDLGLSYRVRTFGGTHEWAPADVTQAAVEWIRLKAMQAGTQSKEPEFIRQMFERTQLEAHDAEKEGDTIAALGAYRSLVSDFSGLEDVAAFSAKLQELKDSKALKQALRKEDAAIDAQQNAFDRVAAKLNVLAQADPGQVFDLGTEILAAMRALNAQAAQAKDHEKHMADLRAFNQLCIYGNELGQSELAHKHVAEAINLFQVMSEAMPKEPWPLVLLAEANVARGDKKEAIRYVREAVQGGLKDGDALEQNDDLAALRSEPDFQKIVEALRTADRSGGPRNLP